MIKAEQIHEFDCEIYPRKLWVAVGVPYAVIKDMFEDVAPMDENTDAQVDNTRRLKPDIKGGLLVRFENRNAMTSANITHEAAHVAMEIFAYVGAYPDPGTRSRSRICADGLQNVSTKLKIRRNERT